MKRFTIKPVTPGYGRQIAMAMTLVWAPLAHGQVVFDFESSSSLNSTIAGGDKQNFAVTNEQGHGGSGSLKFIDNGPEPYESFTYDVPFDGMTSGIISVWFYDTRGGYNTGHGIPQVGGSIILEDKNNPQDFVAMEVESFPYGKVNIPAYYASEGIIDRLKPSDRFDSANLPARSVGFHKVEFHVSPTDSRIFVDGVPSTEVAGPGSSATLRLRFMADSPSNGGSADNWITTPRSTSWGVAQEWLYYDDISFAEELPVTANHTNGFEVTDETPEYDSVGAPASPGGPGVEPHDNPFMHTFVNQWGISTSSTVAHTGAQSAQFINATPPLRSVTFDLTGVQSGTSATLYFYDALGQNTDFDKNNSIILENANDPAEFIAVEINNWPYPYGAPSKNYFLTEGASGTPASGALWSRCLPARTIGWHKVEIGFYPTYTLLSVDGAIGNRNDPQDIVQGPGVDKTLRLRLMADGATQGGFSNWTEVNELTALYEVSTDPYVYYDDISLPIAPQAAVEDWQMY